MATDDHTTTTIINLVKKPKRVRFIAQPTIIFIERTINRKEQSCKLKCINNECCFKPFNKCKNS